jgi:pimeloyl-ACP methyl ester carboxylesterase
LSQAALELHTLLAKAGIPEPYILVGHSLGGFIVREYAAAYPQQVAGVVLVDASHENSQMMMNGQARALQDLSRGRAIPEPRLTDARDSLIAAQGAAQISPPFDRLPTSVQRIRSWAMSQPRYNAARASEFDYLPEEAAELGRRRATDSLTFGNRPLVVVTRAGAPASHAALQSDLLKLSSNSRQIIASSRDHHVHLTDPAAIIAAVNLVIGDVGVGQRTMSR